MSQNAFVKDLQNKISINFAVNYLGSVPIETSVNEMVKDLRTQTIRECISHLAGLVELGPPHEVNSVVGRIIGEFKVENSPVEINVSSNMVKIIKNNRIAHRHPLSFWSIGAAGENETATMFGYIAKNFDGTDRRCHVLDIGDSEEVARFAECLNSALGVMVLEAEPPKPSTSRRNDGFAVPIPPKRRSHLAEIATNLERQLYYHGKISREEALPLLTKAGDFLVRQSNKSPGQFILSGLTENNEYKHLMLLDESHKIVTCVGQFKTVSDLVDYYMSKGLPVVVNSTSIQLRRPILRKH